MASLDPHKNLSFGLYLLDGARNNKKKKKAKKSALPTPGVEPGPPG